MGVGVGMGVAVVVVLVLVPWLVVVLSSWFREGGVVLAAAVALLVSLGG